LKSLRSRDALANTRDACARQNFRYLAVRVSLGLGISGLLLNILAMAHAKIETIRNGPYIVTGEVELIDADGNKFPVEKRMALCRCGASTEKPFCDGTHSKVGFKAAEKAVPESKE
jgi:3-phenylpropionate/trans-cinnamate dioxygenase ferredoxin subunit